MFAAAVVDVAFFVLNIVLVVAVVVLAADADGERRYLQKQASS